MSGLGECLTFGTDRFWSLRLLRPERNYQLIKSTAGQSAYRDKCSQQSTWQRHIGICKKIRIDCWGSINKAQACERDIYAAGRQIATL